MPQKERNKGGFFIDVCQILLLIMHIADGSSESLKGAQINRRPFEEFCSPVPLMQQTTSVTTMCLNWNFNVPIDGAS